MPHEKDCALFTMWVKDIEDHLKDYGMDTVFKIPHDVNFRVEYYLIEQWGICDYKDFIYEWVETLKTGVITSTDRYEVCKQDLVNLEWSGKFIKKLS